VLQCGTRCDTTIPVLIGRLLLAIVVAASVVLSAPFIRDIRNFIKTNYPGQYVKFVAAAIAIIIGGAVVVALVRIRDRRGFRYSMIAAALALGTSYAMWNAQGLVEIDTVERFHFVEYGLVSLLFYRAFRPAADLSLIVLPILAGLIVGTLEEWLQWFIPGRIGDMRDVILNLAAIVCGLLFSIGVDPAGRFAWSLRRSSRGRVAAMGATAVMVFAAFLHTVHLGGEINDPEVGRFRSRYDAASLLALARDRGDRWRTAPPLKTPPSLSREDQYLSEGLLHVTERNNRWRVGDYPSSWFENLIIEKYYPPLLTIWNGELHWPDGQRNDGEQRYRAAGSPPASSYVSSADVAEGKHFIRLWPKPGVWASAALIGIILVCALGALRRSGEDGLIDRS
jgi:hypothetical protein